MSRAWTKSSRNRISQIQITIPLQVEMTFTKTKNILSNEAKIPHPLDQPADSRFKDVDLNFAD